MPAAAAGLSRTGLACAAGAFALWGLYPFYFKALAHVPALEIVVHRAIWSTAVLVVIVNGRRAWPEVRQALIDPQRRRGILVTTALIAANWLAYVVAVTTGQVLEASLGYFLCPLVNVVLGVTILGERLTRAHMAAVGLAAAAVLMVVTALGIVPKLALFLAVTFGLYGLMRKRVAVDPLAALFLECALLVPVALALGAWLLAAGSLHTVTADPLTLVLLVMAGMVTVGPLLLFGYGAKRLPLSIVGLFQYITPSILFIEGITFFGEPLDPWRLGAFALIWTGLAIYSWDGLARSRAAA